MAQLKRERILIDREMKMFNFMLLSSGITSNNQQYGNKSDGGLVTVETMYHKINCVGIVEQKDVEIQGG